ncbi:hypothetical protein DFJ58DRAFT_842271 [Suillus subalutaceus]|uniref:uncharacterized protein n=1 Tax=Suillus subalutaceus TaxID=48586 RepID=UPI001B88036C|nr:uncharacterized protein DFJ58DRAFT_842271 [Suillus subalutaceus]KAG1851074.1 hypothetical protein DFJ58DRAFT_842271 [Suillus subalutaceus]
MGFPMGGFLWPIGLVDSIFRTLDICQWDCHVFGPPALVVIVPHVVLLVFYSIDMKVVGVIPHYLMMSFVIAVVLDAHQAEYVVIDVLSRLDVVAYLVTQSCSGSSWGTWIPKLGRPGGLFGHMPQLSADETSTLSLTVLLLFGTQSLAGGSFLGTLGAIGFKVIFLLLERLLADFLGLSFRLHPSLELDELDELDSELDNESYPSSDLFLSRRPRAWPMFHCLWGGQLEETSTQVSTIVYKL